MNSHPISSSRTGGAVVLGALVVLLLLCSSVFAQKLPAVPPKYFNDYAKVVSTEAADRLNRTLEQFERDSSNQILVVVYPKFTSDLAFEDFTQRTAESWRVGQKKLDNGAVLFVFAQDRKMRIEVGYGLEGAIPDLLAKQIMDNEIRPAFRAGNFEAGLTAGVNALMQASRGEYKGTGRTTSDKSSKSGSPGIAGLICPLLIIFLLWTMFRGRRGAMYGPRGRRNVRQPPFIFWGGGGGGGGWGGGGGFGGGGFSGGGGSFGGGGASGDW